MAKRIIIAGAGIGGLTTALALQQRGIACKIYDAAALEPTGAGIIMPPNAMAHLHDLGLASAVTKAGWPIERVRLATSANRTLAATPLRYAYDRIGSLPAVAIHRGTLQQLLLEVLDGSVTHAALSHIDGQIATLNNGSTEPFDILIGADGIHSAVRKASGLQWRSRTSSLTCWRGVSSIQLAHEYQQQLTELWGSGNSFGFTAISASQVYWFATGPALDDNHDTTALVQRYASYISVAQQLIESTDNLHISPLSDIRCKQWTTNNIALLGDAAHAMAPNMGQGGAQAIEDAVCLATLLANGETNLATYQKQRQTKTQQISQAAWSLKRITTWKNPLLRLMRFFAIRAGQLIVHVQLKRIYTVKR